MSNLRAALREPMVWLVVGLPIAAMIASLWLVAVAVRSGKPDDVIDKVRHTGQIQTADLDPDARAAEMKLAAVFQSRQGMLHVFPADGDFDRTHPLRLTLLHPQHQVADQAVDLVPDDTGWHARLDLDRSHDWIVHLTDQAGRWRLRGRLSKGEQAARLGSSLAIQ